MSGATHATVVIAGASLVGLLVALELRSRAYDVVVLERRSQRPGGDSTPAPVPLTPTEASALGEWLERHQVYPPMHEVEPTTNGVDTDRLWQALVTRVTAVGARIVWERRVLGVNVVDGAVIAVRTDAGETPADTVVVAAGAEAVGITPALGLQLPVIPERSAWMRLDGLPGPAGWLVRDASHETGRSGVHLACLWRDGAGRGIVGAYRCFGADGDRRDALARSYLVEVARTVAPVATVGGALNWRLHAHTSADHLPVVGGTPRATGVVLALPHGPFGNARAVEVARRACDAVLDRDGPRRHAWSLDRFPQAATGGRMEAAR